MRRIGITTRLNDDNILDVKPEYISYLENNGLMPVILKYTDSNLDQLINSCDGFIISGGDDLDPAFYGETNTASTPTLKEIDLVDQKIVNYCVKTGKPLLGICRGMQAINVFLGGSLYQDIPNHKETFHEIKSLGLFSEENFIVNTFHHQAIKVLAKGLKVIAIHEPDGIIEAIIHESLPIIAIQWHPEQMADSTSSKDLINIFKKYLG